MVCRGFSEPCRIASFMGKRISAASPNAKAELSEQVPNGWQIRSKARAKMPTTTNRRRAYIRRCLAIAWSSRTTELWQASTSLYQLDRNPGHHLQGLAQAVDCGA